MSYLSPKIWKEFQQALNNLKEDAKPRETLAMVLEWMRKYPDMFNKLPFSQYSFNRYLDLDVQEYPVEYSIAAMDNGWLSYIKNISNKCEPKEVQYIAQFLNKTLENLLMIEIEDVNCPVCAHGGVNIYANKINPSRLAFECGQCGNAWYMDGVKVSIGEIDFAKTANLNDFLHEKIGKV
jgi:hypothetical protein